MLLNRMFKAILVVTCANTNAKFCIKLLFFTFIRNGILLLTLTKQNEIFITYF